MNEQAVQAVEARIAMAAERLRALAAERAALAAEVDRLQSENAQLARGNAGRVRSARECLGLALAELREDGAA